MNSDFARKKRAASELGIDVDTLDLIIKLKSEIVGAEESYNLVKNNADDNKRYVVSLNKQSEEFYELAKTKLQMNDEVGAKLYLAKREDVREMLKKAISRTEDGTLLSHISFHFHHFLSFISDSYSYIQSRRSTASCTRRKYKHTKRTSARS